jgi:hypothetical protein
MPGNIQRQGLHIVAFTASSSYTSQLSVLVTVSTTHSKP